NERAVSAPRCWDHRAYAGSPFRWPVLPSRTAPEGGAPRRSACSASPSRRALARSRPTAAIGSKVLRDGVDRGLAPAPDATLLPAGGRREQRGGACAVG